MAWDLFGLFPVGKSGAEPLHHLPNGRWITLSEVTAVVPLPETEFEGIRVVVHCDSFHHIVRHFEDYRDAVEWADEFADLVNESRGK